MYKIRTSIYKWEWILFFQKKKACPCYSKLNQRASNVPSQYMGYIQDNECYVKANRLHQMGVDSIQEAKQECEGKV